MTEEHIYESAKGINFLSWHDWAQVALTEEELAIYFEISDMSVGMSPEKIALYNRWVIEEQITKHTIYVGGVEVLTENF